MRWKLIRMFAAVGALVVASVGYATLEAQSGRGACYHIAPFCSNSCSCGPMRCGADCTHGCEDWLEEAGHGGAYTVWCEDIL